MKGLLRFTVLRMISKSAMSGEDVREEIASRKGSRPSPGTIYPVLKLLNKDGMIKEIMQKGKEKKYTITPKGKKVLKHSIKEFVAIFCDMKEEFERAKVTDRKTI
jgi:PadR family transcriptional regulator, regulatory protein PadR